jgi:hypothetical protein
MLKGFKYYEKSKERKKDKIILEKNKKGVLKDLKLQAYFQLLFYEK